MSYCIALLFGERIYLAPLRRGVRAAEGARLESVCTLKPYRGFESLPLRQFIDFAQMNSYELHVP
jgi:hypothetical protein